MPQSSLDPASGQAADIAILGWVMFASGAAVLVLVAVLLAAAVLRGRRSRDPRTLDGVSSRNLVLFGGVALPVLAGLALVVASARLSSEVAGAGPPNALRIEVAGRMWWWEVHYLDAAGRRIATTANEIHVPVGRPVSFLLKSDNVIHSFWVPNLQGKIDLVPGRVNRSWFTARAAGAFRGQCAEYCGLQHANMALVVVAEPEAQFAAWLAHQAAPAPAPAGGAEARGREVFFTRACAKCHAVRGTPAAGTLGPDLTHVASRRTLAAGALPNGPGNLAGWVSDPQHIKPGNLMPRVPLQPEELHALLAYLQALR